MGTLERFTSDVSSRTVGLPGIPPEPDAWLEPWGLASLVVEGLFVILFAVASRARPRPPVADQRKPRTSQGA